VLRVEGNLNFLQSAVIRHSEQGAFILIQIYIKHPSLLISLRVESHSVGSQSGKLKFPPETELIFIDEYYRGGWVHDKTRRRRVGGLLRPPVSRLTPAEADRKAKPCRGRRRLRRSLSKRVPWSAETRGEGQSAGGWHGDTVAAGVLWYI